MHAYYPEWIRTHLSTVPNTSSLTSFDVNGDIDVVVSGKGFGLFNWYPGPRSWNLAER